VGRTPDLRGLVDLLARLMRANRTTGNQVTTGDTRPGRSHWVAGRTGQLCRRCGTPIRRDEQESYDGRRPTWWCPTCQPRGGAGPTRPPSGRRGGAARRTA
jgi:formamidopyrimidine-DNA glycosylase